MAQAPVKTALANYFKADNQEVVPEAAELYIEMGNSLGMDPDLVQRYGTQGAIPYLDLQMEDNIDPDQPALLDRSLGDSLAFMEGFGRGAPEELVEEASNRYDTVFVLEQFELDSLEREGDKTRTNDEELSREVHDFVAGYYEEVLDYDTVEVPCASLSERAELIAENSELEMPDLEFDYSGLR